MAKSKKAAKRSPVKRRAKKVEQIKGRVETRLSLPDSTTPAELR